MQMWSLYYADFCKFGGRYYANLCLHIMMVYGNMATIMLIYVFYYAKLCKHGDHYYANLCLVYYANYVFILC